MNREPVRSPPPQELGLTLGHSQGRQHSSAAWLGGWGPPGRAWLHQRDGCSRPLEFQHTPGVPQACWDLQWGCPPLPGENWGRQLSHPRALASGVQSQGAPSQAPRELRGLWDQTPWQGLQGATPVPRCQLSTAPLKGCPGGHLHAGETPVHLGIQQKELGRTG